MLKIQIQNTKYQAGMSINLPDNKTESLELAINHLLVNAERSDLRVGLSLVTPEQSEIANKRMHALQCELSGLEYQVKVLNQTVNALSLAQTGELSPSDPSKTSSESITDRNKRLGITNLEQPNSRLVPAKSLKTDEMILETTADLTPPHLCPDDSKSELYFGNRTKIDGVSQELRREMEDHSISAKPQILSSPGGDGDCQNGTSDDSGCGGAS